MWTNCISEGPLRTKMPYLLVWFMSTLSFIAFVQRAAMFGEQRCFLESLIPWTSLLTSQHSSVLPAVCPNACKCSQIAGVCSAKEMSTRKLSFLFFSFLAFLKYCTTHSVSASPLDQYLCFDLNCSSFHMHYVHGTLGSIWFARKFVLLGAGRGWYDPDSWAALHQPCRCALYTHAQMVTHQHH